MKYNTSKKYKCPYCNYTGFRDKLVSHVTNNHEELIPQGYTTARVVFNSINNKTHGVCVVCKKDTPWNENSWKYDRLCGRDVCRKALADAAHKNNMKVYHTDNLAALPSHQEKMLQGRKISGRYTFSDGKSKDFTGQNEKKCLEFMDKVMNIPSKDIITPGPTLDYEFEGKKHFYITDIYYIPANLIIECKDGGNNPNNRPMLSYRAKQDAKEEMITKLGKYNYIRLTDNNFTQLLEILADIKYQMIDDSEENRRVIININEEVVGGLPPAWANDITVIQYSQNNVFTGDNDKEGFGVCNTIGDKYMNIISDSNKVLRVNKDDFLKDRTFEAYEYRGKREDLLPVLETAYIIEDSLKYDNRFKHINLKLMQETTETVVATIIDHFNSITDPKSNFLLIYENELDLQDYLDNIYKGTVHLCHNIEGYYLTYTGFRGNFRSSYYATVEEIRSKADHIVNAMLNITDEVNALLKG